MKAKALCGRKEKRMAYGIRLECWGAYACFTRPEMKVERVSYDVMTPSAARGLIEAIYWHPGLRYVIDEIDVLNPIRFMNVKRNEVEKKLSASDVFSAAKVGKSLYLCTKENSAQRAAMILRDVKYCIHAHFEMTDKAAAGDNPGKFQDILCRRARKGQCFHQPCFGCREFPADFRLVEEGETVEPISETRHLGYMLYDMDFHDPAHIVPMFFNAKLEEGVLDLRNCEVRR